MTENKIGRICLTVLVNCGPNTICSKVIPLEWNTTEIGHQLNLLYLEIHPSLNQACYTAAHILLDCDVPAHTVKLDLMDVISNPTSQYCDLSLSIYGLSNLKSKQKFCFHIVGSIKSNITINPTEETSVSPPNKLLTDTNYLPILPDMKPSFHISILHVPPSAYGISCDSGLPSVITIIKRLVPLQSLVFLQMKADDIRFDVLFDLTPATDYDIWMYSVEGQTLKHGSSYRRLGFSKLERFRTYFTVNELKILFDRAVDFLKCKDFAFLEYFYRNKPKDYYKDIFENHNGIMKPYVKDENGDRSSIINRNIEGLFFNVNLDRKLSPPPMSYFGRRRAFIRSDNLFHSNSKLYFADFYCHYEKHYVTLVITEKDSRSDSFCTDRLLSLDIFDNPFLKLLVVPISEQLKVYTVLSKSVHVEVLYTESVDLMHIQQKQNGFLFKDVGVLGRGASKPSGIPKNEKCQICNINPC